MKHSTFVAKLREYVAPRGPFAKENPVGFIRFLGITENETFSHLRKLCSPAGVAEQAKGAPDSRDSGSTDVPPPEGGKKEE